MDGAVTAVGGAWADPKAEQAWMAARAAAGQRRRGDPREKQSLVRVEHCWEHQKLNPREYLKRNQGEEHQYLKLGLRELESLLTE